MNMSYQDCYFSLFPTAVLVRGGVTPLSDILQCLNQTDVRYVLVVNADQLDSILLTHVPSELILIVIHCTPAFPSKVMLINGAPPTSIKNMIDGRRILVINAKNDGTPKEDFRIAFSLVAQALTANAEYTGGTLRVLGALCEDPLAELQAELLKGLDVPAKVYSPRAPLDGVVKSLEVEWRASYGTDDILPIEGGAQEELEKDGEQQEGERGREKKRTREPEQEAKVEEGEVFKGPQGSDEKRMKSE